MTFDTLSQISFSELGEFFGGLAALCTALWAIGLYIMNKRVKKFEAKMNATVLPSIRSAIEQTLIGRDPASYFTHDIIFSNGISLRAPMIPNVDLWIAENLTICVLFHDEHTTTLAMKSTGSAFLPQHRHRSTSETIEVRCGTITHLETGIVYHPGDVWEIPADTPHAAVFSPDCFALVVCRPALPTAEKEPVNLTGLEEAFSNHWKNKSHERTGQYH